MADERALDERIEQSHFICRSQNRDPTAAEIDALQRGYDDHVSFYINTVTRSNTKRTFDETNESMVGEAIEVDDATNERCAPCSDVEDEEKDVIAALCGNGGAERAAKPGTATPVNFPFRVIAPVAPGRPTEADACDRPVEEMNPDDVQGYDSVHKRVTESGRHKMEFLDMNWEDG